MIYWLLRFIVIPLLRSIYGVKIIIIGKKNIPKNGAVIASNHNDNSDSVLLSLTTRRRIFFLVRHELFYPPHKTRYIIKLTNNIPAERFKGKSQQAIDKAVALIKKGYLFAIFPEGAIKLGRHNHLYKKEGYTGVARIALQARAPVVPVYILNNKGMFPNLNLKPERLPKKILVKIGKPIYFEEYYGQENNREVTRLVTNKVIKAIRSLKD